MRTLGCLLVIVLVCVGIYLLASTKDMTDEQKAQWAGEKAHRGWNRAKQLAENARQGWNSAPPQQRPQPDKP